MLSYCDYTDFIFSHNNVVNKIDRINGCSSLFKTKLEIDNSYTKFLDMTIIPDANGILMRSLFDLMPELPTECKNNTERVAMYLWGIDPNYGFSANKIKINIIPSIAEQQKIIDDKTWASQCISSRILLRLQRYFYDDVALAIIDYI